MTLNVFARYYKGQNNIFTFNLRYLYIVGLWPSEDMSPTRRIYYKIFETTITVLTITLIIITGIGLHHTKDNMAIFLASLDKILVAYNFFSKTVIFTIKRDKLKALIQDIENSGDRVTEERKELMAKYVIFITILSVSIISTFSVLALFEGDLIMEAWMPFDPKKSQMNLLTANQILAVLCIPCALRAFAMKGLVCSLIMYLCDQLIKMQEDISMLEYSEEFEMEMKRKLNMIVKKHARLMGYSKAIEMIFREYFLIQNLVISVELCLTAVMMTVAGVQKISLFITILAYLFVALLNAYIYCYLGNELITKSEDIAQAAYDSTWVSWPVDLQKDLLIMIMAAQRPFKLSAGGIAVLSLETFGQTLCNGYSIFALLRDAVN